MIRSGDGGLLSLGQSPRPRERDGERLQLSEALIAALVARAHMLGQVRWPTEAQAKEAAVEGWIWLPDRPARFLLGASQQGCQLSGW